MTTEPVDEHLRTWSDRYRVLFERSLAGFYVATLDGRVLDCNDSFARTLGFDSREDLLDRAEPLLLQGKEVLAVSERARGRYVEACFKRRDGSHVWVLKNESVTEDLQGQALLQGTLVDITERKLAEDALLDRTREAALSAAVGVALTEGSSLRRMLHRCAEALVRHLDAAIAQVWTFDVEQEALELQAVATNVDAVVDLGAPGEGLIRRIAEERQPAWTNALGSESEPADAVWASTYGLVAFAGYPLIVEDKLVGVVAMFAQQTLKKGSVKALASAADAIGLGVERKQRLEREKQLEEHLQRAQKMEAVGRLAGGIAHDFNNLLAVILNYASIVLEELRPEEPIRQDVEEIQRAGQRAAQLTRQLLIFSRKEVVRPIVVDLNDIIAGMERLLRRAVGEDIQLVMSYAPMLACVKADQGQLEQVLMNVAINARDAMAKGGRLLVETSNIDVDGEAAHTKAIEPGRYVRLLVTDTGCGMTEDVRSRVFEPFFTTKPKGQGTGLGLSTVYGIITQSKGHVGIVSSPGEGTQVEILLPACIDEVREPESKVAFGTPQGGQGEVVLVTEDEDAVRALVCRILSRNGYRVVEARGPGEALLACERNARIDLLLTDVVMPQMSGKELADRLSLERADLKVLFMSGYTDDIVAGHAVQEGQVLLLPKPFTEEQLLVRVRELLDGKGHPRRTALGS